jgi:hypothetical protein
MAVAEILSDLLKVDQIGANANFFMMGGHSLLGAQLIARAKDRFGVGLTLRKLFEYPTVAGMAKEIERLAQVDFDSMTEEELHYVLDEDNADNARAT